MTDTLENVAAKNKWTSSSWLSRPRPRPRPRSKVSSWSARAGC